MIRELAPRLPVPISVDTYKASTARVALAAGARIVNDVWGLQREPDIARVAADHGAPVMVMHNREAIDPAIDIVADMLRFFERSLAIARRAGIPDSDIVLDPGIGFGKSWAQHLEALRRLPEIRGARLSGPRRRLAQIAARAPARRRDPAGGPAVRLGRQPRPRGDARGATSCASTTWPAHVDALRVVDAVMRPEARMSDRILVERIAVFAYHGLLPRRPGSVSASTSRSIAGSISRRRPLRRRRATVSYADLTAIVVRIATERRFALIEALAEAIAAEILGALPSSTPSRAGRQAERAGPGGHRRGRHRDHAARDRAMSRGA